MSGYAPDFGPFIERQLLLAETGVRLDDITGASAYLHRSLAGLWVAHLESTGGWSLLDCSSNPANASAARHWFLENVLSGYSILPGTPAPPTCLASVVEQLSHETPKEMEQARKVARGLSHARTLGQIRKLPIFSDLGTPFQYFLRAMMQDLVPDAPLNCPRLGAAAVVLADVAMGFQDGLGELASVLRANLVLRKPLPISVALRQELSTGIAEVVARLPKAPPVFEASDLLPLLVPEELCRDLRKALDAFANSPARAA